MKPMASIRLKKSDALALLSLIALSVCSCRSLDQPASASFASVIIADRTDDEVHHAADAVFAEAGYESFIKPGGGMIFEKEGTRGNQIAHGGWIEDRSVRERVKAEIVTLPNGSHRLQCHAFMVRHAGDSFFEEEVRLANFRGGPYQKLLEQVAARLK